jgi:plastocyanin
MSYARNILLSLCLSFAAVSASAGEIVGTASGANVVVWVEGALPAGNVKPAKLAVSQRGVKFTPGFIVAQVGQTVEMPNDDNVAHNVYSLSTAKKFNLGVYAKGESRSVVFDTPGVVDMKCWLHKRMNATVVVVPNRFFSVAADGSYRIAGVPAGTYRVAGYRDGAMLESKTVKVNTSGSVRVDY